MEKCLGNIEKFHDENRMFCDMIYKQNDFSCFPRKHRMSGHCVWSASGWGSFWESSSFVPWLVFNAFREGSGVVPERPGSSGFIRKSSSRASAPRMRFSVLLNSFDNLFVTLPSISSETWVMYSSCDLGAPEFCAKLLLGCFSQFSLFNSANFLLFRVVISLRKSNDQSVILYYLSWKWKINLILAVLGNVVEEIQQYWIIIVSISQKNVFCIFISPIYTFPWRET